MNTKISCYMYIPNIQYISISCFFISYITIWGFEFSKFLKKKGGAEGGGGGGGSDFFH